MGPFPVARWFGEVHIHRHRSEGHGRNNPVLYGGPRNGAPRSPSNSCDGGRGRRAQEPGQRAAPRVARIPPIKIAVHGGERTGPSRGRSPATPQSTSPDLHGWNMPRRAAARIARRHPARIPIDGDIELRLLMKGHANKLFALTARNRDHLRQWLPWVDRTRTPIDTMKFIGEGLDQLRRNDG